MPRKESQYPADWLRIANKDYARVDYLLKANDPEAAGFYLQQALEKFLKAFLLSRGWKLQRIHDLEPLLNEALTYDPSFEQYRHILQRITAFYYIERYPFTLDTTITEDDVREAVLQTQTLIESIRSVLKR
ncbi:MAG TPA: HEPN domain-containing protein [Bacteroidota bacterium]